MATLDEYLDQLSRELQAPPEETTEILREIRSHLEMALNDLGRNGAHPAALDRALDRFGAAELIGQELRQVHGRATWQEVGLTISPLLLFTALVLIPQLPLWIMLPILAGAAFLAGRARWPLWWWAWLGWLPSVIPSAPNDILWGVVAYCVILILVSRRDWLEATLAIYPLSTAWAFNHVILNTGELQAIDWSVSAMNGIALGLALVWAGLLVWIMRTPPGTGRIARVLEGQVIVPLLNGLIVVAARFWPTYPVPYPFTWNHFLVRTLPYAVFGGVPLFVFFALTTLPAILALIQMRARRRPPSRSSKGN